MLLQIVLLFRISISGLYRCTWCPLRVSPCLMSEERLPCAPLICRTNLRSHISHLVTEPSSLVVTSRHSGPPIRLLCLLISSLEPLQLILAPSGDLQGQPASWCSLQANLMFTVPTLRACLGSSGCRAPVTGALALGYTRYHWSGRDSELQPTIYYMVC